MKVQDLVVSVKPFGVETEDPRSAIRELLYEVFRATNELALIRERLRGYVTGERGDDLEYWMKEDAKGFVEGAFECEKQLDRAVAGFEAWFEPAISWAKRTHLAKLRAYAAKRRAEEKQEGG